MPSPGLVVGMQFVRGLVYAAVMLSFDSLQPRPHLNPLRTPALDTRKKTFGSDPGSFRTYAPAAPAPSRFRNS